MRSLVFNVFMVVVTTLYAFVCVILSLLPGRKIMMASLRRYTRVMVWGMRRIAHIDVQVTGHDYRRQASELWRRFCGLLAIFRSVFCDRRCDYEISVYWPYPDQNERCGD